MCDLGFILLRILRPWNSNSSFTETCIDLKKEKEDSVINLLTGESRAFFEKSKEESKTMFNAESLDDKERHAWENYVKEMLEFYIDSIG